MISPEPIFIDGPSNVAEVIRNIYPRVAHIKIQSPFPDSLFPFKNDKGELIQTPMQMSA